MEVVTNTISAFGCVGNIFIMIIVSHWDKLTSGGACMFSLALADFLSVFYDAFIDSLPKLIGYGLVSANSPICAISTMISWVTSYSSFYITVLFSLDKCIAVVFPFKYKQYAKPKLIVFATLLIYFCETVYALPVLFVVRLHEVADFCYPVSFKYISRSYYVDFKPRLTTVLNGFVPVCLVLILTTITIIKIRRSSANVKSERSRTSVSRRDNEITRQMIVVGIFFGFFNMIASLCIRFAGFLTTFVGKGDPKEIKSIF